MRIALTTALLVVLAAAASAQSTWPSTKVSMDSGNTLQEDVDSGSIGGGAPPAGVVGSVQTNLDNTSFGAIEGTAPGDIIEFNGSAWATYSPVSDPPNSAAMVFAPTALIDCSLGCPTIPFDTYVSLMGTNPPIQNGFGLEIVEAGTYEITLALAPLAQNGECWEWWIEHSIDGETGLRGIIANAGTTWADIASQGTGRSFHEMDAGDVITGMGEHCDTTAFTPDPIYGDGSYLLVKQVKDSVSIDTGGSGTDSRIVWSKDGPTGAETYTYNDIPDDGASYLQTHERTIPGSGGTIKIGDVDIKWGYQYSVGPSAGAWYLDDATQGFFWNTAGISQTTRTNPYLPAFITNAIENSFNSPETGADLWYENNASYIYGLVDTTFTSATGTFTPGNWFVVDTWGSGQESWGSIASVDWDETLTDITGSFNDNERFVWEVRLCEGGDNDGNRCTLDPDCAGTVSGTCTDITQRGYGYIRTQAGSVVTLAYEERDEAPIVGDTIARVDRFVNGKNYQAAGKYASSASTDRVRLSYVGTRATPDVADRIVEYSDLGSFTPTGIEADLASDTPIAGDALVRWHQTEVKMGQGTNLLRYMGPTSKHRPGHGDGFHNLKLLAIGQVESGDQIKAYASLASGVTTPGVNLGSPVTIKPAELSDDPDVKDRGQIMLEYNNGSSHHFNMRPQSAGGGIGYMPNTPAGTNMLAPFGNNTIHATPVFTQIVSGGYSDTGNLMCTKFENNSKCSRVVVLGAYSNGGAISPTWEPCTDDLSALNGQYAIAMCYWNEND